MKDYTKAPLSYSDQVTLLKNRGLTVRSTSEAERFFQHVNYYRFSAYCIPFQNPRDVFIPGSDIENIIDLYLLDEKLRMAVMALLSPVEVFLRTRIVYELSHYKDTFGHYDSALFRDNFDHQKWINSLEEEVTRGKETFLEHFKNTYNGFPRIPLWVSCEMMSIGTLSMLYHGLIPDIQRRIVSGLEVHQFTLTSWMHFISYLRNICAHHSRLWNRELAIRPFLPNKDRRWVTIGLRNDRLFAGIAVIEWLCCKAELPLCNAEPVYEIMTEIANIDTRFAGMMGVPPGKRIGLCWETEA